MGSEMGSLSSPSATSYRLPIVTISLSLTVFAVLRMFQTDGQTDRIGLAIGGTMRKCICRQKLFCNNLLWMRLTKPMAMPKQNNLFPLPSM